MSTRSLICIKEKENVYECIYCHFDGYVEGVGQMLDTYYKSKEKMQNLIALGDMSYLRESIECPEGHTFIKPKEGYSVFYGRDRGETNVGRTTFTYESLIKYFKNGGCDYLYVYEPTENKFLYSKNDSLPFELLYLDVALEDLKNISGN